MSGSTAAAGDGLAALTALETLALTGYGHFTTMRVENGAVRGLRLHLDRLARDSAALFGTPVDPDAVRAAVRAETAGAAGPVTVRVTVFDPALPLTRPSAAAAPRMHVTVRAATPWRQPALRVRSTRHVRDVPAVKHTGLFGALYERRRAQLSGYDDALFTDHDGLITEGVTWNIGFWDGAGLVWPMSRCLPGITAALVDAAHDGVSRTEPVALSRLSGMEAAFATNAAGGLRAISSIDGTEWSGDHPVLELLRKKYAGLAPDRL